MHALMELFHQVYNVRGSSNGAAWRRSSRSCSPRRDCSSASFCPAIRCWSPPGCFAPPRIPRAIRCSISCRCILAVSIAAVVGDQVGFYIGRKTGPRLFKRENSLLFNKKHLVRTHEFYERHGGKTIIIARFMPIIRTFAPVVAGVGDMNYRRFVSYNVFGGIGWVISMTGIGYGLATVWPDVTKHIEKLIILVIFLSLAPRHHRLFEECWPNRMKNPQPDKKRAATDKGGRPRQASLPAANRPKVAFPKKNQPPTAAAFAARLPLALGKRFEMARTFLLRQKDINEDVYFYGPKTGWALRYLISGQPLCALLLHGDSPVGIVSLPAAAAAAVDWKSLSPLGQLASSTPTAARRCCGWTCPWAAPASPTSKRFCAASWRVRRGFVQQFNN